MNGRYFLTILFGLACVFAKPIGESMLAADASESTKTAVAALGELREAGLLIFAIAVGTMLLLEKGLREGLGPTLKEAVGGLAEPLRQGMAQGAQELAKYMPQTIELRPRETQAASEERAARNLPPELVSLAKQGKADAAVQKLVERGVADEEAVISVLSMSTKIEDLQEAAARLEKSSAPDPALHLRLAFKFWEKGNLPSAIQLAERGLQVAPTPGLPEAADKRSRLETKLKNSLAYYYAESGDMAKADASFRLMQEVMESVPNASEYLDSLGCVKIAFGKREQIESGIQDCCRAAVVDGDYMHFRKWLNRAIERMDQLSAATRQG
ncbi:MAG: tetratricopeptide repeat protein [Bryobacteraceae bacterium]